MTRSEAQARPRLRSLKARTTYDCTIKKTQIRDDLPRKQWSFADMFS